MNFVCTSGCMVSSGVSSLPLSGCSDKPNQDFNNVQIKHPEARESAVATSEELAVQFKQFHDVYIRAVLEDLVQSGLGDFSSTSNMSFM